MHHVRQTLRLAACAVLAASLAACSITPDDAASADPSPVPEGWQAMTFDPITVQVPDDFEQVDSDTSGGVTTIAAPDDGSGVRAGVTVQVNDEPTRDAATELKSIYYRERATNGADDVTETQPDLDGATAAASSSFSSELLVGEEYVPWEQAWLVADLESGQQVVVGAMGPTEAYDRYELDAVLESLDLTP